MTNIAAYDDLEVEETELGDDDEPQAVRFQISSFPTDFTVKVMYQKWRDGQLIIPDFQRGYVWNQPQASRLIESFLLGLPIPQIFLYRERNSPKLLVIDGHQRLATIACFYSGKLPNDRVFRLRGINPIWDKKTYEDLSEDDQIALDDATLRSIVIQQTQPDDNSSIYQIFERLNTGGTQLNSMEIRKAVFHGQAYDFVERLNSNPNWRKLLGMAAPDRRLRDVELVLRVLALAEGWERYSKPMKSFVTVFMDSLKKADPNTLQSLAERFEIGCARLAGALPSKPFHLHGRLNVAALDAIVATAVRDVSSLRSDTATAYEDLKGDASFLEAVSHSTSDSIVVHVRFRVTASKLAA